MQFSENQNFRKGWILIPMGLGLLIPLVGLYQQMVLQEAFGNHPMSNLGLLALLLFIAALIGLIWYISLQTEIDARGIQMTMRPFVQKHIPWSEVKTAELVNYGFVGGWGIRQSFKYGTVYNIGGSDGLALVLKDGKKICIGTQKPIELQTVILEAWQKGWVEG